MEELGIRERGTEISREKRPTFTLQWHLTTACPNHCKHCYMERNSKTLDLEDCKKIVDDFSSLLTRWNCNGEINFTGGDPLLHPHFFDILGYTNHKIPGITIGILGNPELLTEEIAEKLRGNRIRSYQMSLDGLEKTHDYLRHPGSFRKTLDKLNLLEEKGIKTAVMSTVSLINLEEIPRLVDLAVENKVDIFDFHRFVPIGSGIQIEKEALIPPLKFRQLLLQLSKKYKQYENCGTFFGQRESLWTLLQLEEGTFAKEEGTKLIWSGCSIGCSAMCILEDGTVLACRRLPLPIGKLPNQKLRDIFILSEALNKMRETKKLEKCNNCELLLYCRGCRAVAYASNGDYYKLDPQCWK